MHGWLGTMRLWCLALTLFLFYAYFKPIYRNVVELMLSRTGASISFTFPPVRAEEKRMQGMPTMSRHTLLKEQSTPYIPCNAYN